MVSQVTCAGSIPADEIGFYFNRSCVAACDSWHTGFSFGALEI